MKAEASSVTDFAGLNALRAKAAGNGGDEETLRAVARQFEALLMQQVLKSARASGFGDDLAGGPGADTYKDLFDQQMAQQMSAGRGLGIADVLVRQLRGQAPEPAAAPSPVNGGGQGWGRSASVVPYNATTAPLPRLAGSELTLSQFRLSQPPPRLRGEEPAAVRVPELAAINSESTADPDQFIRAVWPQAEVAAKALGLPTEAVVGHAALETGWGRHRPAGDSHNYFGIKADAGWKGARAASETTEVRGGVAGREQAEFRRYASPAEGFADYVRFLRGNPRYGAALAHGGDATHFAQGLQKAGYATDPDYARKLLGAIERVRAGRAI